MSPAGPERAARQPPAHPQAHQAERPQIIPREPRGLVDCTQRGQPGPRRQVAVAQAGKRADRVVVLHEEAAPVDLLAGRYRLAGQVQVGGQRDVGARGVAEDPELRAEPRVEIKQVVLAAALVQADIEVENSPVAQLGQQPGDLLAQFLVRRRTPEAGQPGIGRIGPLLNAGEGRPARRSWRRSTRGRTSRGPGRPGCIPAVSARRRSARRPRRRGPGPPGWPPPRCCGDRCPSPTAW